MQEERQKLRSAIITVAVVVAIIMVFLNFSRPRGSSESTSALGGSSVTGGMVQKEECGFQIIQNSCNTYISAGVCRARCVIVIQNTSSSNLYLSDSKCDIEDDSGILVGSKTLTPYPNIISPGEKAVFYSVSTIDNGSAEINYRAVPKIDAQKAYVQMERLPISDFSLSESSHRYFSYVGRVENTTSEKQSLYTVAVILYGKNNEVIAVDYTYPNEILPGEKTSFESNIVFDYSGIAPEDIARYEVIAFTYQLQF